MMANATTICDTVSTTVQAWGNHQLLCNQLRRVAIKRPPIGGAAPTVGDSLCPQHGVSSMGRSVEIVGKASVVIQQLEWVRGVVVVVGVLLKSRDNLAVHWHGAQRSVQIKMLAVPRVRATTGPHHQHGSCGAAPRLSANAHLHGPARGPTPRVGVRVIWTQRWRVVRTCWTVGASCHEVVAQRSDERQGVGMRLTQDLLYVRVKGLLLVFHWHMRGFAATLLAHSLHLGWGVALSCCSLAWSVGVAVVVLHARVLFAGLERKRNSVKLLLALYTKCMAQLSSYRHCHYWHLAGSSQKVADKGKCCVNPFRTK